MNTLTPTTASWEPSSKLLFTCPGCTTYSYFESHCRYCGLRHCTKCVSVISDSLVHFCPALCKGIPEGKETILKACFKCNEIAKRRRRVILWAKLLMRWYTDFEACGLNLWNRLAQSEATENQPKKRVPSSLRAAARCLIEAHERCVIASRFEYMSRSPNETVIPVEKAIVDKHQTLLYYDICHRTDKMALLEKDTRLRLTAPLFLMLSATDKNYNKDVSRCIMRKYKKQLSCILHLVKSQYQSDFHSHVAYVERMLHVPNEVTPSGSGLAAVMASALCVWKQTACGLYNAIDEFDTSGALTPETCMPLTFSDVMLDLKRLKLSGVTVLQEKTTCLRLTLENGKQTICYRDVNTAFMRAAAFINNIYAKHYRNVTCFLKGEKEHSIFLLNKDSSTTPTICIASLSSQLVGAQILTAQGFLLKKRLRFKDVQYTVDDEGYLIILGLMTAKETSDGNPDQADQAVNNSPNQTARSIDLNGKLSLALTSREYRYWLCRAMGACDDAAREFAQLTPYTLEQYMVHDY